MSQEKGSFYNGKHAFLKMFRLNKPLFQKGTCMYDMPPDATLFMTLYCMTCTLNFEVGYLMNKKKLPIGFQAVQHVLSS